MMRRGHPGPGGWRSEGSRPYRPRGGGTGHFRGSRSYGPLDTPRFPHPGQRFQNPGAYSNEHNSEYDRGGYRGSQRGAPFRTHGQQYPRGQGPRQILPHLQRMRQDTADHSNSYKDPGYYESTQNSTHINNLGDIDHRQTPKRPSPWIVPPYSQDRSPTFSYRHQHNDQNRNTPSDYAGSGHRPLASDHYGNHHSSSVDSSNTFSRSVDDTVNIVRQRLQSRESHSSSEQLETNQGELSQATEMPSYSNQQQEPVIKKRSQNSHRIRNVKSNCNKIKSKIVQQLFMMDKDKIHKLMDNPNSSSKFEFAISSLVTESQNSYNRHLRSAAEKSLCSSSSEFVHNDTNTIYEDTFMKQMQCILEPQDTVLLEDIKPIVLAELCKVLQIDDLEQRCEEEVVHPRDEQSDYSQYPGDPNYGHYDNYPPYSPVDADTTFEQKPSPTYHRSDIPNYDDVDFSKNQGTDQLFDRQKWRDKSQSPKRFSSEHKRRERSMDKHDDIRCPTPVNLFEPNVEHLSEEDDPFAELDKQYHVAVDPNLIENYDMPSPQRGDVCFSPVNDKTSTTEKWTPEKQNLNSTVPCQIEVRSPFTSTHKIREEIDNQLQDFAKSPIKLSLPTSTKTKNEQPIATGQIKQTPHNISSNHKENVLNLIAENNVQETAPEPKIVKTLPDKSHSAGSMIKTSTPLPSRKRSIDQKPPHRKEKRKKSESSQPDSSNQITNKNIIINLNDCAAKSTEKCDQQKEKNNKESSKDSKKVDTSDKGNSDKHEKRKEISKKTSKDKDKDNDKKKQDSSTSSHSILSPSDSSTCQTPTKGETQIKLKPIDMFIEQPRRPSVHHAHRNTAPTPVVPPKTVAETKPLSLSRKVTKRHIATQVARKCVSREVQTVESKNSTSRFCQTEKKRLITRGSQTNPFCLNSGSKATDTLERMKEIDFEIQSLLQEKFKLYNSLGSKKSGTMQSLGMTVLNVTPVAEADSENNCEDRLSEEDAIVDNFTSTPVEELEQIAFESGQEEKIESKSDEKMSRRPATKTKEVERTSSQSPTTRSKRKTKTPNFPLLEQIITDERPLEDIISLDDLETTPSKSAKKKKQKHPKPKKNSKKIQVKPKDKLSNPDIKPCSITLIRQDLNLLLSKLKKTPAKLVTIIEINEEESEVPVVANENTEPVEVERAEVSTQMSEVEVPEVNDIQFDMLDVSEDIVIGDVCEVKCSDEKDASDTSTPSISEEIILDNSQSSMEDAVEAETEAEDVCKTYDYASDENLRRDSIVVSGNGDAILAIESLDDNFLAASLDGNVYHFSNDGQLLTTLRGSNLAVTCLTIVKNKYETTVYTGSLDSRIRYYDLDTGLEKGPECNVLSPIQTMDLAWDTIFVGTRTGFVLQFECKNNILIPVSTVKFSEQAILALRAIKEGPRKVLLVAARSEAVAIKDAQTGLLLRTLEGPKMTVYTLLFEDGKVYCGTSSHQIHVFDYASGSHVHVHESGKGVVCVRCCGGLVLAGCYDGCVYVYRHHQRRALAQLRGPSLMLLSLAVLGTKIIAGYKDRSLYIWKIPLSILQEMIL